MRTEAGETLDILPFNNPSSPLNFFYRRSSAHPSLPLEVKRFDMPANNGTDCTFNFYVVFPIGTAPKRIQFEGAIHDYGCGIEAYDVRIWQSADEATLLERI
jgi:hypothetical protein